MTSESYHRRYRAEQLLIEARRQMIRECCQSSPLELDPDFYGHGGRDYASISHGGTKLEIKIGSGVWSSTTACSFHDDNGEGVITGTKENFLQVLEKVFPEKNMRGA